MTVQEIFETPAIREIETSMIDLQYEIERSHYQKVEGVEKMRTLISLRRNLLADMFVMDEHYKQLLSEFNDAMTNALSIMRENVMMAVDGVADADVLGDIRGIGKCYLGYKYSKIHPVQSKRAKQIWAILNGSLDSYVKLYEDGVLGREYVFDLNAEETESENSMLYLSEEIDNWNEGFDTELTKDMHLTYAVHHLTSHTDFSIFDLLWVRDFNLEMRVDFDYDTYPVDDEPDEDLFL